MSLARPTLILSGLLLFAPVGAAQDAGSRPHPGARVHHMLHRLADKLGLTQEQRSQVKSIAKSHGSQMQSAHHALVEARRNLASVLDSTPQDADAIRAASGAVAAAQADLDVARGARRAEVRTVLTPEQQSQAHALEQRRADHLAAAADGTGHRKHKHPHKHGHKKPTDGGPKTPPK